MLQPIQKDNDLICRNCGCVVGQVSENPQIQNTITGMTPSMFLLGSAIEINVKNKFPKSSQQFFEERALLQLNHIVKEFGLPESLALDAFKELKKKRRGFRSESRPIKQLLDILSRDENYLFMNKMKAIKARYEIILRD